MSSGFWGTLGARLPPSGILLGPLCVRSLDFIGVLSLGSLPGLWEIPRRRTRNAEVNGSIPSGPLCVCHPFYLRNDPEDFLAVQSISGESFAIQREDMIGPALLCEGHQCGVCIIHR